jgi:hypothetical protein
MAMATVYKYRVWCETDGKHEFVWGESPPTKCPSNTAHSIDENKTIVVDKREESLITIREENVPTGGHYQARFCRLVVPSGTPGELTILDLSFPHPISLLAAEWTNEEAIKGDEIEFHIAPNTVVGAIGAVAASGDSTFTVQQSVIDNVEVGYRINLLSASGHYCDLGRCLSKNDENNTITTEFSTDQAFSPLWPTYVRLSVEMVRRGYLAGHGRIQLGEAKIGGSYIAPNTTLRARYWNNDGKAKELVFILEYLY